MFFAMFTLQTGVPAFQREGGLPTVRRRGRRDENILEVDRWSERDTRAGRYCTHHLRGADTGLDGHR